jgi:hypothetical protein
MAQNATVAPRITQAVDDSTRVALKGNVPARIRVAADRGAADESTALTHMRLVLRRSTEQETALQQYLSELQQKSSPNYHKWLTPEQFGKLYGLADSDIAALAAWLESQGFTVNSISQGRTNIDFSGNVAQVQTAFRTSIHSYQNNGQQFYANTTEPTIPAAFSAVVAGVAHLNTIAPRPFNHSGLPGIMDKSTGQLKPLSTGSAGNEARSLLSYEDSSSNYYLYVVPADAAMIYDTPNSTFNTNYSGTTYTGSGVTIGIGGDAVISTTPVVNYRTQFFPSTYSSVAPTITNVNGDTQTADADEAYMDIEISAGLAPGATIHYYNSSNLDSAVEQAIEDNAVDIFSLSFGACESDLGSSGNALIESWWEQAAAQGIAVTVSSGDNGSAGCDDTEDSNNNAVTAASGGLAVSGFASTPYNIAVGGTDYYPLVDYFSTYVSETNSSSNYYRTAKGYIPESTWNDSTYSNTTISANEPWTAVSNYTSDANIVAGSGGVSSVYSRPSWQRGTGVPSGSYRDIPDISLLAGNGLYGAVWLVCDASYPCSSVSSGVSSSFDGYGGTSASAPAFAGILALIQQSQGGGRLGMAAANLYNIFNNSTYSGAFHDVTVGNNSVPCTSGTSNCSENNAGYYFESGYDTTTGYDLATGLGSVDVASLAEYWSKGTGSATATVTVTPASSTINIANSLSVNVVVSGSSSTPTGTVSLTDGANNYTSSAVNLDDDSATIIIPANSLASGSNILTVAYSGDGNYSSATGTTTVTVDSSSSLTATTTSVSASSTAPTYGTSVTLTATVSPSAAAGTVIFYDSSTVLGTGTLNSGTTTTATYTTSLLSVGTHTITATYTGNTTYASSTSSSITVTVSSSSSSGTGSFTLSATNATASQGSSGSSTVTITPANGYTGTVGLSLATSSTSLQEYGCYYINSTNSVSISGTSSVQTTLTLYTSESDCSSSSAVKRGVRHNFVMAGTRPVASSRGDQNSHKVLPISAAALAGCLLIGIGRRRRKWFTALGCFVLLGVVSLAIGCGGGSSSTAVTTSNYVAKGTYTLTLTGTDSSNSSLTSSTALTLVVD